MRDLFSIQWVYIIWCASASWLADLAPSPAHFAGYFCAFVFGWFVLNPVVRRLLARR